MYKLIVAIIRHEKIEHVIKALKKEQIAFTYSDVKAFSKEIHLYKEDIHDRIKLEIVAREEDVHKLKDIVLANACCGLEGDGCVSVYVIDEFISLDTGTDKDEEE